MLELSRVAAELGSELGLIFPFLISDRDQLRLELAINFVDATDPAFLATLRDYRGPINNADLNAGKELVVPDLRDQFVTFKL